MEEAVSEAAKLSTVMEYLGNIKGVVLPVNLPLKAWAIDSGVGDSGRYLRRD